MSLLAVLWLAGASFAQSGPVPTQIAVAKKVFVSNVAEIDFQGVFDSSELDGGPGRLYDEFYGAMKNWGRYDLVASPGDADLIVEVGWFFSPEMTLRGGAFGQPRLLGQIHVVLVDPRTHVTLWNLAQTVSGAAQITNRNKNFEQALAAIVTRVKLLANPSVSSDATHP